MDLLGHQEVEVHQGRLASQVYLVQQDLVDPLDQLVLVERKGMQEILETLVQQDQQDHQDPEEHKDQRERLGHLDPQDQQVYIRPDIRHSLKSL